MTSKKHQYKAAKAIIAQNTDSHGLEHNPEPDKIKDPAPDRTGKGRDAAKAHKKHRVRNTILSIVLLPVIMYLHLTVCLYLMLNSIVTMTMPSFVIMICASVYLYYSISAKVRKLYFGYFGWKAPVYNVVYYLGFGVMYYVKYLFFLVKVRTEEGYVFETEGAFFTYVYKVFPIIFVAQIALIIMRWVVRTLYRTATKSSSHISGAAKTKVRNKHSKKLDKNEKV